MLACMDVHVPSAGIVARGQEGAKHLEVELQIGESPRVC